MKRLFLLLPFALLFSLSAFVLGCNDDENPASDQNSPPVISSVTASPSPVDAGGTSTIVCTATDADGDALSYSWSATQGEFPQGISGSTVQWTAPASEGTCSISVTVSDGRSTAEDDVAIVVENGGGENQHPTQPSGPVPADGAEDVPESGTALQWSCSDPDGDELTYDIYLGTDMIPDEADLVATDHPTTSYTPTILSEGVTYYWQVEADDGNGGRTEGPVWSFTVEESPVTESDFELGETGVYVTMVWIPAGTFEMGAPGSEQDRESDEGPVHTVTISEGFWLGKYEVTQEQWEAVMGSWDFSFNSHPDYPAESVSYNDITNDFLPLINSPESGDPWRLPTEAEWEYAARAGTSTRFYWGDDPDETEIDNYAWYGGNSTNSTHPVGEKQPNAWGLYDMSGHVWEWCQDWYDSEYYSSSPLTDPTGPTTGTYRVKRGGRWSYYASYCRSASRSGSQPPSRSRDVGFRLLRSAE